jgi:rod shape-determining protein MreC
MKRKESFLPTFLVVFFLCIIILVLSLSGNLKFLSSFLEKPVSAIQSLSYNLFQKLPFISEDLKIKRLKDENLNLLNKISDYEKLKKENAALSDQFQTAYPQSIQLLKAEVIGASGFIPGVSVPNVFILNKGTKDNIKKGSAVVIKDNLVGVISQISTNLSQVAVINNPSSSFTAKTQNGASGLVKGGGNLILDGILLSENIKAGELVLTKGDINSDGVGIPPDLVVGKITSVEKNPSDLFQKAEIASFVNFVNLSTVFVYIQAK